MFSPLLKDLDKVYKGDTIYLPEVVYDMVITWIKSQTRIGVLIGYSVKGQVYTYRGKRLLPFNEENMMAAYQSIPIHVPERILEKSIVIEVSLEPKSVEQPREEVKPEPSKPEPVRYGRREGTKRKDFNQLF